MFVKNGICGVSEFWFGDKTYSLEKLKLTQQLHMFNHLNFVQCFRPAPQPSSNQVNTSLKSPYFSHLNEDTSKVNATYHIYVIVNNFTWIHPVGSEENESLRRLNTLFWG